MKYSDAVIIGAGPAGLAAAVEIAKAGGKVTLLDENNKPGGQLFKQIHKFFGSSEHLAGTRGYNIGQELLENTKELGVEVILDSPVHGIYHDKVVSFSHNGKEQSINAQKIILATGASENTLAFPGSTLPGVMGAGAAQTMINVHQVLPGKKILMIGSGNVGLIVTYQLLQAGADVLALIEAAPQVGGYGVHAAKIRRAGVPIFTSHTISKVWGNDEVQGAIITQIGKDWRPIPNTEKRLEIDTVCIAVGLTPLTELAWLAGCKFTYIPRLGGHVPVHNSDMQTTVPGIYVAGDITGVEEASSAMEEGHLAGVACSQALGLYDAKRAQILKDQVWGRLNALRTGPFGEGRRQAKEQLLNGL